MRSAGTARIADERLWAGSGNRGLGRLDGPLRGLRVRAHAGVYTTRSIADPDWGFASIRRHTHVHARETCNTTGTLESDPPTTADTRMPTHAKRATPQQSPNRIRDNCRHMHARAHAGRHTHKPDFTDRPASDDLRMPVHTRHRSTSLPRGYSSPGRLSTLYYYCRLGTVMVVM